MSRAQLTTTAGATNSQTGSGTDARQTTFHTPQPNWGVAPGWPTRHLQKKTLCVRAGGARKAHGVTVCALVLLKVIRHTSCMAALTLQPDCLEAIRLPTRLSSSAFVCSTRLGRGRSPARGIAGSPNWE
eukprot:scaffold16097_cov129-Isochrysis_galbana.AAC.1